jgi:peroxiredoxin
MNMSAGRINSLLASTFMLILAAVVIAADPPGVRVGLYPEAGRKPAAGFALQDAAGKTVKTQDYRGKVVLLDFWATWCTGCKKEIPWFSAFQATYGEKGLAVIGVSMDEDGWKALRPFLEEHRVPYEMVLGDSATGKGYGIANLPDTFLIDRQGRVAAAYREGLVDRENVEANIKTLLSER